MPFLHACVHESGHAIVAMALGVRVHCIDVRNEDTALCMLDTPEDWRHEALILMSGFLAACHVVPAALHYGLWVGASRDRRRLARILRREVVSKARREALWDQAGDMVESCLPAILDLAERLMVECQIAPV